MKDIGNIFKEKREEIGITIEEAAADLKLDSVLIDNLEDGNDRVFKDVLEIKDTIKVYAKYLGLNSDEILNEYDGYLFEKTSKISVSDIKEGLEKTLPPQEKKVKSPYTIGNFEENKDKNMIIILSAVLLFILVIMYFIIKNFIIN